MANTTGLPVLFATGNHAGRPAASAVGAGGLYSCTTHSLVYQTDGSSWSTWATLGTSGAYVAGGTDVAIADGGTGQSTKAAGFDALSPMTTSGDIIYGGASGTGTRLAKGTDGQVLTLASGLPSWAAAGGGGSSDAILGQSSGGGARISGLQGSPDIDVAGTNDDEFNTTDTSDPMTGWTTLGTPTAHDINSTAKSHYYVRQATTGSTDLVGIYKAIPSAPFTVTCKLSDAMNRGDYNKAFLFVAAASPGAIETLSLVHSTSPNQIQVDNWTNRTSYASTPVGAIGQTGGAPMYLRCVVTTTTNIAWYYSQGGLAWRLLTSGRNPGFTVGSVGLGVASMNGSFPGEGFFDWIRFT